MTILFKVKSKLGKDVSISVRQWALITVFKHPIMTNKEELVKSALEDPDEIRRSKSDPDVHLYYKAVPVGAVAVVVKHLNGEGFIITAYITDKIKEGVRVYER